MIRAYKESDLEDILRIWYKGSCQAHDFINPSYWKSQMQAMKEIYIPMAETYVMTDQSKVIGFISMVDKYLAALFVDGNNQNNGAGRRLLAFVKDKRSAIRLKVYKENLAAIRFYKKSGFVVLEELTDEQTDRQEYVMEWINKGEKI